MLLRASPEGILRIWPVDKRVGNVRNDGPDLLEPQPLLESADGAVDPPESNPL